MSSSDEDTSDDEGDEPALYRAVWDGQTEIAQRLIRCGADVDERYGLTQDTALRAAVVRGNSSMIALLLANGADPDLGTHHGTSPIHMAAWKGYTHQASLLISGAANVSGVTHAGYTPLDYALRAPSPEMMRLLLHNGAFVDARHPVTGATTLRHAVQAAHNRPLASRESICVLIEHGANVSSADRLGVTPLYIAAIEKNRDFLLLLLEMGGQYSTRDPANLSLLYQVLDFMGVLERNLAFAGGRRRIGTMVDHMPREMMSMITSYHTKPRNEHEQMVAEIALVALGWV